MKKKTYKKQFGYLFLTVLMFLGFMVSTFPQQKASAAPGYQVDAAKGYCTSQIDVPVVTTPGTPVPPWRTPEGIKKRIGYCQTGFLAALKKNAPKPPPSPQVTSKPCTDIYKNSNGDELDPVYNCQIGYVGGYSQRDGLNKPPPPEEPPTPQEQLRKKARERCIADVFNGDKITAEHLNGGDLLKACVIGYVGASDGKNKNQACGGSGIGDTYCKKGFDLAKSDEAEAGAAGTETKSCESEGGPLGWIICKIIVLTTDVTDFAFKHIIVPTLETVPVSTNRQDSSYKSWQGFRFLANIMLIGTLLAIVYSQAKGGE